MAWSTNAFLLCAALLIIQAVGTVRALDCGWPGKPAGSILMGNNIPVPPIGVLPRNGWMPSSRVLAYEQTFTPGQMVSYQCHREQLDVLRSRYGDGISYNRTCQEDGTWTGSLPYCDVNVAYGRMAQYAGNEGGGQSSTPLLTDGLANSQDPENTAECISLSKNNGFFNVDLGQNYAIRSVIIFGKEDGTAMNNVVGQKLTLGNSFPCQDMRKENKSTLVCNCQQESSQFNPAGQQFNSVRFEHTSPFVLLICEVVVYSNPSSLNDCGEPEIPANGEVSIKSQTNYQEAEYNCRYGYELKGERVRTCYGRVWSGDQPTCIESTMSSTTSMYNHSTDSSWEGENAYPGPVLDTFQIVLIVVCVALAIGLIVALIVLLKYGKLACCKCCDCCRPKNQREVTAWTTKKWSFKKNNKPAEKDYEQVKKTNEAYGPASGSSNDDYGATMKKAAAMAAADQDRQAEEEFINAQLAYQNEQRQKSKPPRPSISPRSTPPMTQEVEMRPTTYAELQHEPRRSSRIESSPKATASSPVIYAKVHARPKSSAPLTNTDDSSLASETFVLGSEYGDEHQPTLVQQPNRKSYVPYAYRKESPEVQMKQQALNDQLKEAVRVNRVTDF